MKRSWGKIRVSMIAGVAAIAFALMAFMSFDIVSVAPLAYSATPSPKILVTNGCTQAVTAYSTGGGISALPPQALAYPIRWPLTRAGTFMSSTPAVPPSLFTPRGATVMPPPSPPSAGATPA